MAAAKAMGLELSKAAQSLSRFACGFGRMEKFEINGTDVRMILIKNPAGCNQVLDFLTHVREKFSLVVTLNDRAADGTDISWIWDADFEMLSSMSAWIENIVVSGDRAAELATRIKYAGMDSGRIRIERDYRKLVEWADAQETPVFMMPTYTSMLELREAVIRHCGGDDFWV